MNRREKEGTQANITRFFEGSVGAGAFAPRVRNGAGNGNVSTSGPSGKKKGTSAAGKRLGAALSKLAEREGARGGKDDDSSDGVERNNAAGGAESTISTGRRKRKAASTVVSTAAEDDVDVSDEDEDGSYQEPKKKRTKKTRKA